MDYLTLFTTVTAGIFAAVWLLKALLEVTIPRHNRWLNQEGQDVPHERFTLPLGDVPDMNAQGPDFGKRKVSKFGNIYKLFLGPKPLLMIADPLAAKEFYSDQLRHHRERDFGFGYIFFKLLGSMLGVFYGDDWKRIRKGFSHPFSSGFVASQVDAIHERSRAFATTVPNNTPTDAFRAIRDLPFLTMSELLYGRQAVESKAVVEELRHLLDLQTVLLRTCFTDLKHKLPFYRHMWWTETNRKLHEFETRWAALNLNFISEFTEQLKQDPDDEALDRCILGSIVKSREAGTVSLSDKEIIDTLNEILLTNVDGSAAAFAVLLYDVAAHPSVQQRIREEIPQDMSTMSHDKLNDMKFLECVIKESGRLHPIMTMTAPELTAKDSSLGGHAIPKGTAVSIDVISLNRNPKYWDEAETFLPERFDKTMQSSAGQTHTHVYHQFGLGPRKCLGYRYANVMMKLLVVSMLERYNLKLEDGATELKMRKEDFVLSCDVNLVFEPRKGGPELRAEESRRI